MAPDEVPPENIWHHSKRLEEWFQAVKQKRKDGTSVEQPDGDDEQGMTQNELTKGLR